MNTKLSETLYQFYLWKSKGGLTLIGMRGDTFISLSFLDKIFTSHSAYVATATESDRVKIDGLLPPTFL